MPALLVRLIALAATALAGGMVPDELSRALEVCLWVGGADFTAVLVVMGTTALAVRLSGLAPTTPTTQALVAGAAPVSP